MMAGFEHREEAERLQGINQHASAPSKYASRRRVGVYAMNRETRPLFHKFRGRRGRVRARYRRPQLGRGTEKPGETSQRKTNLELASGAFSCKVAPFTPAGKRTKKAPSRGGRTGSNGQQHPVVIDCEVLRKRRSRGTTPGELRATRTKLQSRVTRPGSH